MVEDENKGYCDAHGAYCIRIKHLEKGQDGMANDLKDFKSSMEKRISNMWYLMLVTLISVLTTGVGVFLNLIIKGP